MSLRRRGTAAVALAVAATLSLGACGSGSSGSGIGSGASTGAGSATKDSKSVAKGGKDFGDAAEKTAALGTDARPGQWPRTIKHAMGSTEIKAQPKRVVVLDVGELDNVVSLGVRPVGVALSEG
jgi:iron complex transport system substrate-binding protein